MADESVVAMNPQPMKAGNSLEDKTGGTLCRVAVRHWRPKAPVSVKGRRHIKICDRKETGGLWQETTTVYERTRGTHCLVVTSFLDNAPAQMEYDGRYGKISPKDKDAIDAIRRDHYRALRPNGSIAESEERHEEMV